MMNHAIELMKNYSKPAKPAIRSEGRPPTGSMLLLRCYYGDDWALCRYVDRAGENNLQAAFNAVMAVTLDVAWRKAMKGSPKWVILPSSNCDKSDPQGQDGYVGAKWETVSMDLK